MTGVLFDPFRLHDLALANRVVLSPMTRGRAGASRLPNRVMAAGPEGSEEPALLRARATIDGAPAAYVCERFTCKAPVSHSEDLARLLS